MPTFIPEPQNLDRAAEPQLPVAFGEGFATAFESAAMAGPLFATLQANEVRKANTWGTRLTADQARQAAAQRGFPALNIPEAGLTDQALEVMLSLAETDAEENEKLARTGTLTRLGGGFLGSMGDPVGGLLNFVPVVGNAKQAKIIAQASTKFGALGRAGARAGIGAAEGAVGGLLTIPASALAVTAKGGDYTLEDAIFEEVSSVVMGAGFQAGAGILGEGVAKVADQSSIPWIREKFGTDSQEWRQVQEAEQRARQEIEPEAKAQAEDEARSVAQPEAVEPVAPPVEPRAPGVEPQPVRKSRGWSGAPFVRERLEVVSGLRNALGDLPVFREAAAKSDPLAVEIVDALRKSEGEIVARPAEFATLARAANAVVTDRANALTVAEGFKFGTSRNLTPHEQAAAVAFDALRGQPERMARMVSTFAEEVKAGAATDRATARAVEAVATPVGPTEKGRIASPQTIESADAIADFLARSGVSPRAETVVKADPRIGEASAQDVADELARARQPGQQYNAAEVKAAQESFDAIEDIPDLDEVAERLADEAEAEYERITTATDVIFAKGAEEATNATPADARARLVERFGEDLVKLGESFGVEIVPTWRDLPTERTGPDAIAVTKGRKTYIAAAQLPEGGGAGIYLHEMGVHVGLKGMLGEKGFGDILAKSEGLLEADPTLAKIIDQMVPDDTPAKYRAEERLAYLVQNMEGVLSGREDWPSGAEWLRVADPKVRSAIVELVRDIVAKAKAWVYENAPGVRGLVSLDERDFHALAVRALQYGFNGERMEAFAKVAKEAEDEVAAAREASKRARLVYKKAYDAFASLAGGTDAELVAAARAVGDLSAEEAAGLVRRYREAGGDIAQAQKRVEADAAVQRLRAIKNAIKLHEALQFMSGFRDDPIEGLLSLDAGSLWNRKGARNSVEGWSRTWRSVLCNSAERQLKAAGLWDKINDEAFNRPLAHALYDLQTGVDTGLKGKPYNSDHLAAAKIFQEHQRRALSAQRRYGVDSGELKGRILDQQHDAWSLRNFANNKRTGPTRAALRGLIGGDRYVKVGDPAHKKAWVDFILPLLDEKTYDGRDVTREYLEASYDLLAGYKVPREREVLSGQYRELPGEAFRISNRSRKLKFKDADAWVTYQERCGNPNFLENFMGEMSGAANALGVMEVYGPGAEYTRAAIHAAVGIRLTGMQAAKFQGSRTRLDGQWKVTTRQTEIPANEVLASVMRSFRALKRLSLLGSAVASQLPDFGNIGKARALRFNRSANGIYSETARQMADFLRSVKGGANVEKLLTAYQSDLDATTAGLLQRIENGDAHGAMSNMVASLFKWQGMTWLTRNNKNGSIIGLASWLGQEARRGWAEIEPTTREHLEQHGFTEEDWSFMRRGEQIADDGRSYLTPEGLKSIPDAEIVAHLEGKGSKFANDTAKGRAVAQWRMDLQNRMIGMMHDFADVAIKEPDGRSRWFMTMGTQAGTALGETARALSFLKSFTVSTMVNDWNTEAKGRSTDPRARVKAMGASHFLAVANYIAALTLLGFGSYMLKGWAKGIQRKGLVDEGDDKDKIAFFDLPAIDDRVLFASMTQGGSMGLYGDFLFAEKNRFGGGLLETLSGPLIGDLEKLYQIGVDLKTKGVEDPGRLANNVANLGKSLTPFSNLWFSRATLDRMIWWNLQESINPDGLRRMEERAQKAGDRYIFTKPTEAL